MFSFRHNDEDVLYGVLFDIASGSVGVAIVASHKNDRLPKLLYAHRVLMRVTKQAGSTEEHLRRIREALFSAALTASQHGRDALKKHSSDAKITKIYVTCASPWSYTIARNVHYENDQPFKITHTLLSDLVQSAEDEIISQLRESALLREEQFEVVERATVDIAVNEYPVSDPLSLEGRILDLSHVIGAIPRDILTAIHDAQDKLFPQTELRAHTYMLIMYCILRDVLPKLHSVCIIDVTSEATEFGIVEHNLLTENLFIPYGSSSFIRNVAEETGKPLSDIQALIEHDIEASESELQPEIEVYTKHIQKALDDLLSRRIIPSDVIITAERAYHPFFKRVLERAISSANFGTVRVIALDEKIITEIDTESVADVYLALGARFFHKLHGCGEMSDL